MVTRAYGTGPGEITDDGCAVELYRLLPARGEPGVIHAAVPAGARILELGAGAGRVTHPLVALGHEVTAVDDSAAMLACVRGARTVHSPIEALDLGERFDAVVLGSHLLNTPEPAQRAAFLACCRRHVRAGGRVLLERHAPGWFDTATASEHTADGLTSRLCDVRRPAPGVLEARMEYMAGDRTWTHTFRTVRVDDDLLTRDLRAADLELQEVLTPDGAWLQAAARREEPGTAAARG